MKTCCAYTTDNRNIQGINNTGNPLPLYNEFTAIDMKNRCPMCLLPYFDEGKESGQVQTCRCKELKDLMNTFQPHMGWVCPKCNSGISPDVQICPCSFRISYSTGTNMSVDNSQITIDLKKQ